MIIYELIQRHQVKSIHTLMYRIDYDCESITIDDQDEACKDPYEVFQFAALNIPGTDIIKCQEAACKDPYYAYMFARDVLGADIEYCRKAFEYHKDCLKAFDQMIAKKNANIKPNRKTQC